MIVGNKNIIINTSSCKYYTIIKIVLKKTQKLNDSPQCLSKNIAPTNICKNKS